MTRTLGFLFTLILALGCGSPTNNSGTGGGTFPCGDPDAAMRVQCSYNTQYCELATQGGTTTATCRAVPSSCGAGSPCDCIRGMLDGGSSSCGSVSFGDQRATTVSFSR